MVGELCIRDVVATMEHQGVRRLVVVDQNGQLAGVLAVDDIVAHASRILTRVVSLFGREKPREEAKRP